MSRNPFDEIERMFDRMSNRLEPFDEGVFEGSVAVDIEETDDAYVVTADLPGFDRDDIDVELAGDRLTLSATHTEAESEEGDEDGGRYLRRERRQQSVSRSVRLPEPVDEDATEAEYNNGVLTVTLPKEAEGDSGHDIPIN
ncbi:Hsp20/alpha crystallin family protein [Natronomonas halophila]|uniref:Hsp20/alpha crystallin family protein n=1 Tax=Natronomonas halophila TaxID=2747817 RepID=UPI0015B4761E|nr:Hsp20/alpha crystallin family protein [Natronomonas halophila]QLD85867.1 Hsp20/alpha crystallin family protein [Natronomonas halophila]